MKTFIFNFLLAVVLMTLTSTAFAKSGACYSAAELEAEAYLRLHSQLMVVTVSCRTDSQGASLVPAYTGFTKTNIAALHAAEGTIQQYYKVNYGGSGQARLDDMRTKLANEYGQEMADMGSPAFCTKYRDKPVTMAASSEEHVKDEVKVMMLSDKSFGHLCTLTDKDAAKKDQ